MWAVDQLYVPRSDPFFAGTPRATLAALAAGAGAVLLLVEVAVLPPQAVGIAGVTAAHGALLTTALAWARVGCAARAVAVALVGLAAAASHLGALGSCAYLGPALWVGFLSARGRLTGLGLGTPVSPWRIAAGGLVGVGLSAHLLLSASRTLDVPVGARHTAEMLVAMAYDIGANVLVAECFFRGALFARAERRWSFAAAATVATIAYVLRYLVDPLLPKRAGLMVGAAFYLALLGGLNCWLVSWSGSLLPGLVSASIFFAAYRTLGVR